MDRADLFAHPEEDFIPMDPAEGTVRHSLGDGGQGEGPQAPLVPALDPATLAAIGASPAIAAFLVKRIDQAQRHGHTPAADLERNPFDIARAVLARVRDLRELLDGRAPTPERLVRAMVKVEAAGAMLMALHDRLRHEAAQGPAGDGEGA